ncbi:ABC-2 family transporter permease [Sutcliffiella halmapala]|uniref:hypothetical protein n=1 Tax=Sutcliffiella halmapala TaxID=79882 RepID=UPI0009951627|nr:hypothetical protein [Sutcliffiella halmapala]
MIRFFKHLQLELTFIFKNWLFIIAPIIYLISIYIWFTNQSYYQGIQFFYQNASEFLSVGHTLSLGVIILASVLAIRREKQTVMLDWTNSLPTSSLAIISAKFLAINLYSFLFTAIFTLSFFTFGQLKGHTTSFIFDYGINFAIQSQCSYFVSTALGMILAIWIPNRVVYIISFCAWMFGTFFIEGFIIQRYQLYYLKTFHLNQFFLNSAHSEGWAFSMEQQEVWLSRLFVVFFSLLLICFTILKTTTSRLSSHTKKAWISVIAILLLTVSSIIPYSNLWINRMTHYEKLKEASFVHFPDETTFYHLDVKKHRIEMERTGNSTISVHSSLEIPAFEKDELTFILYPTFEIDTITWNGKAVDFRREQHKIFLQRLEQEPINTLQVSYKGLLNEWGYVYSSERNFAFIDNDNIFLPSYIAWYPVIGNIPIFDQYIQAYDDYIFFNHIQRSSYWQELIPKTEFSITLKGFDQQIFGTHDTTNQLHDGTQVLESTHTQGITLFSLPDLVEVKDDLPFSLISRGPYVENLQAEMANLQDVFQYLNTWVPLTNDFTNKLVFLPSLQYTNLEMYDFTRVDNSIFIDEKFSRIINSNNEFIDNAFINIKAEIIKDAILGSNLETYYHYNNSVLHSITQAFLLITYIEFFQYDWEDFANFNGTNYWNLATLSYNDCSAQNTTAVEDIDCFLERADLPMDEKIVYMVAKEIAKGNIEQMKLLLHDVLNDINTNKKTSYHYWEWLEKWNNSIENQEETL